MKEVSGARVRCGHARATCAPHKTIVAGSDRNSSSAGAFPHGPAVALFKTVMTDSNQLTRKQDRPTVLMPVTRLVSRPAVTIVNGKLVAVKVLDQRKAA